MKVLVVGGAGFIGGVTVRNLLAEGYEVLIFDNLSSGHKEIVPKSTQLIIGDLRNYDEINNVFKKFKIDAVMHFAAYTIVPESVENPKKYVDNNIFSTVNLLHAMVENNVKKFIFSSSAAVYGDPMEIPIREDSVTLPTNPYGETKLIVEQILKWYDRAYGIKYVSLRYFNAAGADLGNDIGEDRAVETHLIPLILKAGSGEKDCVDIYGTDYTTRDGTCIRDYIHVKDLASAHVLALKKLEKGGESAIYNLGSEKGFTVNEVVKAAREITKVNIKANDCPRRAGDSEKLIASSARIKKDLGWTQKYSSIEQIVSDTWEWMKRHPRGYKS